MIERHSEVIQRAIDYILKQHGGEGGPGCGGCELIADLRELLACESLCDYCKKHMNICRYALPK